jgi:2-aminoadipate transaminase
MNDLFADRITDVPRSFIREILKVTLDRSIISFAGGLPNRDLFPVRELKAAAIRVFDEDGGDALQYAASEGYAPLREYLSRRYAASGLAVPADQILITNGSQQGLDLLAKTFLNEGDDIVIEEPGYLGAIQAFAVYRSRFNPVPIHDDGIDTARLRDVIAARKPKLMYTVPNFQNPSGISYSADNRRAVAAVIAGTRTLLIEDDPYGDLRFSGAPAPSFKSLIPDNTILLGSFSKTVVPSFRLGWIAALPPVMEKLVIAKQASDLHTNGFVQRIVHRYLSDNDLAAHVARINAVYRRQCDAMVAAMEECFPKDTRFTRPSGGMFVWATLPEGSSSLALFEGAVRRKVVFVPGKPFYVDRDDTNTLRLNFSCVDEPTIKEGIGRLGEAIRELG